jgi:hypothetical protein
LQLRPTCNLSESEGTGNGKVADIIALEENPLDDITALRRLFSVMKEGWVYRNDPM